jgi:HD superfamily phosphohydrolase
MLERVCERLLDATALDVEEFARMTDDELMATLRRHDETAEGAARLAARDLYKRAVWAELDAVPEGTVGADHGRVRALEAEIAAEADVPERAVVLDSPGSPSMPESSTRVVVNGEVRRLHEQSALVQGLQAAQRTQWRLGVYAPAELSETVGRAAVSVLDLDETGATVDVAGDAPV